MNVINKIKKSVSKISPFWLFLGTFAFMNFYLKKAALFGGGLLIGLPLIVAGVLMFFAPGLQMISIAAIVGGLLTIGGGFALDRILEDIFNQPILLILLIIAVFYIFMKNRYK
jgi:hypothetical protein